MALISAFTTAEKTSHNSHKFIFTLSATNYGYWKAMIHRFLLTQNIYGYVDDTIPCPAKHLAPSVAADQKAEPRDNPNHSSWVAIDVHVRMVIISTIYEASFLHVQGSTSYDLWLALERGYAPHSAPREYTLKTLLLKIEMKGDETIDTYLNLAQEYADALAAIGKPVKDKDLFMLVVSGLREEYNNLKSNITARQSPTTLNEFYALLIDHNYMLGKTRNSQQPTIQAFHATNDGDKTLKGSLSSLAAQLGPIASDLVYNLVSVTSSDTLPTTPQACYSSRQTSYNNCGYNNRARRGNFCGSNNNNRGRGDR